VAFVLDVPKVVPPPKAVKQPKQKAEGDAAAEGAQKGGGGGGKKVGYLIVIWCFGFWFRACSHALGPSAGD
jgi:hypothetical protein